MENLCRICGSDKGIKVNIFEQGTDLVRKIHKTLPITVNEHDPFPKHICHRCFGTVEEFFKFRTTSIQTQEMFKMKVPWLRDKRIPQRNENEPPMVEVALNSVNAVSPNEKQIASSNENGLMYDTSEEMNEDEVILIEESPPHSLPKEDPQHHHEDNETDTTKDYYQCSDCGHVFTRHSQLVSHRKKHINRVDSSSDDSFKPFNKRKKHHTKRKHKPSLLNTNEFNPSENGTFESSRPKLLFNFDSLETNITRHSLLSSDSE